MQHFYVDSEAVREETVCISGSDYNHIKNVLRMKPGEELTVVDGESREYLCEVSEYGEKTVLCRIKESRLSANELPCKVVLFQGLPKKDKLELIIQKAVELGVSKVVPVLTKRAVVVPGPKEKEARKTERFNSIALAAAKQCGRGVVPEVSPVVTFKEALAEAETMDIALIPYELADDVERSREIIRSLKDKKSIAVFIGPEGGFDRTEVEEALERKVVPITLGKRILRTETAAICALSLIMYETTF